MPDFLNLIVPYRTKKNTLANRSDHSGKDLAATLVTEMPSRDEVRAHTLKNAEALREKEGEILASRGDCYVVMRDTEILSLHALRADAMVFVRKTIKDGRYSIHHLTSEPAHVHAQAG